MAATTSSSLRIGELAALTGTTPRTIRYYEEIGLLRRGAAHVKGTHRVYGERDVERLRELVRLRDLLGLTLEELGALVETGAVLELVRSRRRALEELEAALEAKRADA